MGENDSKYNKSKDFGEREETRIIIKTLNTMNILKLFIPKENMQVVEELESWTVTWYVKTGWADDTKRQAKVFIKIEDAKEFKRQLEEQAKFIGCWISIDLNRN